MLFRSALMFVKRLNFFTLSIAFCADLLNRHYWSETLWLQKLVLQKQESLSSLSLLCNNLIDVDLSDCESLTNAVCEVFSDGGGCPLLRSLILDNCEVCHFKFASSLLWTANTQSYTIMILAIQLFLTHCIYIYINMAVDIHKALKQFVSLCMPTVFVYSDNKSYGSELLFLLSWVMLIFPLLPESEHCWTE